MPKIVEISRPALIMMLGLAVALGVVIGRLAHLGTPVPIERPAVAEGVSPASVGVVVSAPVILPGVELGKPISAAWISSKKCFQGWCAESVWGDFTLDIGRACVGPDNVVLWWGTFSNLNPQTLNNGTIVGDSTLVMAKAEVDRLIANYRSAGYVVEPQASDERASTRYRLIAPEGGRLSLTVSGGATSRDAAAVMLQPEGIPPLACRG